MPLVAIVGIVAVQVTVRAWRWSFLMPHGFDDGRLGVRRLLPPLLVAYLGNAVLPARLGEPMRAMLASPRERVGTTEALGSVLLVMTLASMAVGGAGSLPIIGTSLAAAREAEGGTGLPGGTIAPSSAHDPALPPASSLRRS